MKCNAMFKCRISYRLIKTQFLLAAPQAQKISAHVCTLLVNNFVETMDYQSFLSDYSKRIKLSPFQALLIKSIEAGPTDVKASAGKPASSLFPFKKIAITIEDGKEIIMEVSDISKVIK